MAQAVGYEPISSARWRLSAETPSFWLANIQQAENQTVRGVRLRSNNVPAVVDVRSPHVAHLKRPSDVAQPPLAPQFGQTKPLGHRSHSKIVEAVGVSSEPRPKLAVGAWVVNTRSKVRHPPRLVRSAE
jgi:hypothetical protein